MVLVLRGAREIGFGVLRGVPAGMGSLQDMAALQAWAGSWGRAQIFPAMHLNC